MPNNELEEVGFIKYQGSSVPLGIMNAGSAGMALIGLDEAVRFFNEQQSPEFAKIDYEIPVKVTDGSWVAWVLGAVGGGAGAFALGYLKKAGEKMAENDFKDVGLKDVIKKSLEAMMCFVNLVKHTGRNQGWDTDKLVWKDNNRLVGVPNHEGELVFLPVEYFKWYMSLPPRIISKLTEAVTQERSLTIGVKDGQSYREATVTVTEKVLFSSEDFDLENEDILFPELAHGDPVKLEGKLTRGNESSNSVGFEYGGHILNCIPDHGSIRKFKPALFLHCVVEGTITRLTKQRVVAEKKPTIILHKVVPLEADDQYNMFQS